jgi:hypothetical protein
MRRDGELDPPREGQGLSSLESIFSRKRVTILAGHFGSGKTEIALNGALGLAATGVPVSLVDLDVVKPYFRSRSGREHLSRGGVRLVAPQGDYYSSDLPIILPQIRGVLQDPSERIIMDAGGDDTGARVVGSLTDTIPMDETDLLLVLNFRRPFTPDVEAAVTMVREIESKARMAVTGLISNTHLMGETTREIILEGYEQATETSRRIGVPLVAVTIEKAQAKAIEPGELDCPICVMTRIVKPFFDEDREQRTIGPLFVVG